MSRQVGAVISRAQVGIDSPAVTVETHLQAGQPGFVLVGLPESALRESRTRVKSAIQNCGLSYPPTRIVVNLAPADLAKEGTRYDLAIAMSILLAGRAVQPERIAGFEFLGELGLFGEIRPTRGALCAALAAAKAGRTLIVPSANAAECLNLTNTIAVGHLNQVVELLRHGTVPETAAEPMKPTVRPAPQFDEVVGQEAAKRALAVAAAGGHHLLMVGPPGAGKTMLASAFAELLPALPSSKATEVAAIYSAAGVHAPGNRPPLRAPHHSASAAALVGGGPHGKPGEITLAHGGVLFLDELPHFKPSVLDHLREPLQARKIELSRARYTLTYPAHFQLIAAMNPCPAGRTCSNHDCRCTPNQRDRYQSRLSGPLLDRIDLHVRVPELPIGELIQKQPGAQTLEHVQALVATARTTQLERQGCLNVDLAGGSPHATPEPEALALLERAASRQRLTARSFHKMLRIARTIADLEGCARATRAHVAEALCYRALDWEAGVSGAA